ncbi:MAG: TIGR03905 family TSCPD domain-containing protein [Oscillospiraceae bacterium]|nr:TIGR03905 family TSCPD domain-containing protein [Oscillospiraceae bacterium]
MKYTYAPKGVCSREIILDVDDNGTVADVKFIGGCNGNLQGISALVKGQNAKEIIEKLKDIDCRGRGTSCPAQLALALKEIVG